ncbi:mandelate racemase/muconate lactonizing enzyme family protein [Streptomyces fuscichromogenes]|uniref:Muconate cycloisomerase n=1 Tax=Streptomyces fuscichromogenes TaxID=1324013 RepID=A0A917XMB2_9ACTN|nr:enolase C-terminal domain-like protein [Streptomyces fuscichromogenes]GGN39329.1 muconate cycloisomerase [Streptomyces fuscichromogenes]
MKITAIETVPYAIPYTKPLRFASGAVHTAEHVLVRVHTDEGLTGVADAPPRPFTYGETQASVIGVIEKVFGPQLVGLDVLARERVHGLLHRTVGNPAAKSAIDMALWDVVGQALGQPASRLLGGYTDRMRVSHMLGFDSPPRMADEAERMRDTYGITVFKIKVGRHPVRDDLDVCRAVREALGDAAELYVDGNRGWTPSEAAAALRELDALGITLAEELCPADDVLGRRRLVRDCPVPFVADESATTPAEVTRSLLDGAATAISIKTARTGFTQSQRVLFQCEGMGAEVVMGNQIDGQLGTVCTLAFGAAHAASSRRAGELSNYLDMSDDLLTAPLRISGGTLAVPGLPGLGVAVDEDKLGRYRQDQ